MKKKILFVCLSMVMTVFLPRIVNAQAGCTPITISETTPYVENFENYQGTTYNTNGVIPTCWDNYTTGTIAPHIISSGDYYYHADNGSNSLSFKGEGDNYAVLPEFSNPINELQISFWRQMESQSAGTLTLGYITDGDVDMNTFTQIAVASNFSGYGAQITYTLNQVPTTAKRLVLKWSYPTDYSCCVDDITVSIIPPCPSVNNLTVSNVTFATADLSWDANGQEYWEIRYRKVGAGYWNTGNYSVEPSRRLTYLDPATQYEAQVQNRCSGTLQSDWSESVVFTTAAEPVCADFDIPYEENFDNGSTTGLLPDCWHPLSTAYREYPHISSSSTNAHSGRQCLYMYSGSSSYVNAFYLSPIVATSPLNTLQVQFYARYAREVPTFEVGVIENVETNPTFVSIQTVTLSTSHPSTPYVVSFANYTGTSQTIAFRMKSSSTSSSDAYLDDVIVKVISNCARVGNITTSNITSVSADLAWSPASDETRWQIQVAAYDATTNAWGDYVMLDTILQTPSFTLDGLNQLSRYRVLVRAYCGEGDYGEWNLTPADFTTIQTPVAVNAANPLYTDDFEAGNNWVLVNGTQSNAWAWGTATNNGGTHSLYISSDGGTSNSYSANMNTVYATKVFVLEANEYTVQYDWKANGERSYDYMRVFLVPADITIEASNLTYLIPGTGVPSEWPGAIAIDGNTRLNLSTSWQTLETSVNVPSAGNYMVVFSWKNDNNAPENPPVAVDNFSIQFVTCSRPNALQTDQITVNSARLFWQKPASATAQTTYNVRYGLSDDDPATYTVATANDTTLAVTGLTPASRYTFAVQTVCGANENSIWSEPYSFETECDSVKTFPWTETFDELTENNSIPICWDNSEGNVSSSYKWGYNTNTSGNGATNGTGHSGNCVRFDSYNTSRGASNTLKSCVISLPADKDMILSFWYKNPKGGDFTVRLLESDKSTVISDLVSGLTGKSSWTEVTVDLSNYKGQDVVLAFVGTSNYGTGDAYIYLDEVMVEETPTCDDSTDVTVSNVTGHTADIAWTGTADSYNVRYGAAAGVDTLYFNDFEGNVSDWTLVDADADGYNWERHENTGTGNHTTHSGLACMTSASYDNDNIWALTPDNWLVSPQVQLGDWVSVWAMGQDQTDCAEHFAIYVSTTGTNPSDFTKVSEEFVTTHTYTEYTADLSAYSGMGYVAVRHYNVSDQFYLNIDDFGMFKHNIDTWQTTTSTTNSVTLTELSELTSYQVQVQAVCGPLNSGWSDAVSFTTPESCPNPTNVTVPNVAEQSADITWTGDATNYKIRYRKVFDNDIFYDDFENGLGNWTIYTQRDAVGDNEGWFVEDVSGDLNGAVSGDNVASSWSWIMMGPLDADNWLVSPQLNLKGILKFWVRTGSVDPDQYEVLLSHSGNAISNFTDTLKAMAKVPVLDEWMEVSIDLSAYTGQSGYIAIHHQDYDGNYLYVDDFTLYEEEEEWQTVTSTSNTITLTNLLRNTQYEVQVMACCSAEDSSSWTNSVEFTTLSCPDPTNVTASNVAEQSADITWDGDAENYKIRYRIPTEKETLYFNDFEEELSGWTLVDADADGYNWERHVNTGSGNHSAHSGLSCMTSASYLNEIGVLTPDNWLITPQVQLGNQVSLWAIGQSSSDFAEHFAIYVSTTGTNPSDFTQVSDEFVTDATYREYTADLSAYSGMGYVAIRHYNVSDQFYINIDDFGIYNVNEYEWQTITSTSNSVTLGNLSRNTTYEVQVMTSCSAEDSSDWTSPVQFTTLSCPLPTDVTVSKVTTQSADVTWNGTAGSYNVRYRVATTEDESFIDDFENGLGNWTIYTQGTARETDGWELFDMHTWFDDAPSGQYVASSWSSAENEYNSDNWLVSPQLELGNLLKYWVKVNGNFPDKYAVYLSTTGNNIADFTTVLKPMDWGPGDWELQRIDLSSYAGQMGYIAIRHKYTDGNYLFVDDFTIANENVSEWHTATTTTNSFTISGLDAATTYEVQVQSDCGDDSSEWVAVTFNSQYCEEEDKCDITLELTDSQGDGWNDNILQVYDANTFELLGEFTNTDEAAAGEAQTYTLGVCDGREIAFTWIYWFGHEEASYTVKDPNGDVIFTGTDGFEDTVYYTMNCQIVCDVPADLVISEIGANSAVLSWSGTSDSYNVQYKATTETEWQMVTNASTPMNLTGLLEGTEYEFQVQAVCGATTSPWSASASFTTLAPCPDVQDYDQNNYTSIRLGGICWMTSNMRTTHYADGRKVPNILKYQSPEYPDADANTSVYGLLYDWYDALDVERPAKATHVQGVCPNDWRMPDEADFAALSANDIYTLRSTNLWISNPGNNATGFNMLPGGQYNPDKNRYENLLGNAYFWSAESSSETTAHAHMADCSCYMWYDFVTLKNYGFSVRCVKD